MNRRLFGAAVVAVTLVGLAAGCGTSEEHAAAGLPPGFVDELIATTSRPTGFAFTPDGRMLITTQAGRVQVVDARGRLLPRPALDIRRRVCTERERGLVGIAVDPAFERNHYVYVYYTFKKFGACPIRTADVPVNRLARYVLRRDSTFALASERLLLDNVPSFGGTHNGGDIHFGKDGMLYVGIGDGGRDYAGRTDRSRLNQAARDLNVLLGKIVRITPAGGIPRDNPFLGPGTVRCARSGPVARNLTCQEIYAWGLRNPFRLAFDPDAEGVRFFINDVGADAWEEIDDAQPGADYGWNLREGFCPRDIRVGCSPAPPTMTDPVFAYGRRGGCLAITGGAFVPEESWPPPYGGSYLFGDFVCSEIFMLRQRGTDVDVSSFNRAPTLIGLVTMTFRREDAALYYASFISGEIRRISYRPG